MAASNFASFSHFLQKFKPINLTNQIAKPAKQCICRTEFTHYKVGENQKCLRLIFYSVQLKSTVDNCAKVYNATVPLPKTEKENTDLYNFFTTQHNI